MPGSLKILENRRYAREASEAAEIADAPLKRDLSHSFKKYQTPPALGIKMEKL